MARPRRAVPQRQLGFFYLSCCHYCNVTVAVVGTQEAARRYIVERRDELMRVKEATDNEEESLRQLEARVSPLIATQQQQQQQHWLPNALAREVMRSPPSVRLSIRSSICFYSVFETD